jgi:hypothetical protein
MACSAVRRATLESLKVVQPAQNLERALLAAACHSGQPTTIGSMVLLMTFIRFWSLTDLHGERQLSYFDVMR